MCETIFGSGLSLDQLESMLLRESVDRASGNMARAARLLGLTRPQLAYRLKRGQLQGDDGDKSNAVPQCDSTT